MPTYTITPADDEAETQTVHAQDMGAAAQTIDFRDARGNVVMQVVTADVATVTDDDGKVLYESPDVRAQRELDEAANPEANADAERDSAKASSSSSRSRSR